ncbi:MAG: TonB-dependent receptor [Prolixibacteraceae bacterium]
MRIRIWIGFLFTTIHMGLMAQSLSDTIMIEEVTLYGDYIKYQPGARFESIDLSTVDQTQSAGIDQLISRYAPIYIKTNAGGLSTINVRGTSPDHTSINFGGININSLTLGQSNVASIPSFLFDKLELQYGSSSTLNGSGAIGGALYLGLQNHWTNGVNVQLKTMQGSFGEQLYGTKLFLGNGKFESVTRLYAYHKQNDFPFQNKYTGNVEDRTPLPDIQHGAAIEKKGLLQEFNYLFSPNEFFKSMVWLEDFWYQIQPNMQTNLHFTTPEEMQNKNVRIWSEYRNETHPLKFQLGAGYVHDYQLYNNTSNQEIITNRLITEISVKHTLSKKVEYRLGAKYKYIVPNVYAYSATNITSEQHLDLYTSFFYRPSSKFKTTINLRQLMVSDFKAPFTPSIGAEYEIWAIANHQLAASGNVSRSYRIPTLNDRFWANLGNPDLLPEEGWNLETGIKYMHQSSKSITTIQLNGYYMNIDNWIEWRNFGVWQARNVQKVVSTGLEFQLNNEMKVQGCKLSTILNYNLNSAQKIEQEKTGPITHEQLIYTPLHMGNLLVQLNHKATNVFIDGNFTGSRKADYLGSVLHPYFLTNIGGSHQLEFKNQELSFSLSINNIFNVNYENEKYYAMPGRSLRIGLTIQLHSNP